MPIWSPAFFGSAAASSGYVIEGSGSFNGTNGKLTRTISSAGNRRTFILEVIFKRGSPQSSFLTAYSTGSDTFYFYLSGGQVYVQNYISANQIELKSDAVLKDFTAWYHLIVAVDTTQSTDTNRVKAWVNGVELTWVSSPRTYPSQNYETKWNTGSQEHQIGHSSTTYSSDYFARAAAYDGLTMTDPATDGFGEYDDNGNWVVLDVSGKNFGTTGFLVEGGAAFTNGTDSSGNSQNFTKGGTITDVDDTITDNASDNFGNYATINLSDAGSPTTTPTFSNGLTTFTRNGTGSDNQQAYSTQVAVGKKYWEFNVTGNTNSIEVGWAAPGEINGNEGAGASGWDVEVYLLNINAAGGGGPWYIYMQEGTAGSATNTQTSIDSSEVTTTPRVKFAIDTDNKKYWLGVVDSSYGGWFNTSGVGGQTFSEAAPTGTWTSDKRFVPYVFGHAQTEAGTFYFRDADWTDSAPSGFTALSTANLPAPTVTDPSAFYQTKTYTGNGSTNALTFDGNSDMQPDFLWIKGRSHAGEGVLVDAVRGVTKVLTPDSTAAEFTDTTAVTAFNSDGFTLGAGSSRNDSNDNTKTYVAWGLKANGSGSSDDTGGITVTRSTASHQGFSICKGTSGTGTQNFAHGLGAKPEMVILRDLDDASQNWQVQHKDVNTNMKDITTLSLNRGNDAGSSSNWWGTEPTSTLQYFTTNQVTGTNDFVCYLFRRIPGLIGIGSYTGNGAADGPYVVIDDSAGGFKPAWLMIKEYSGSNNGLWFIRDSARNPYNPTDLDLYANTTDEEYTDSNSDIDFTANGFKIRCDAGGYNEGSAKNLYLAFAENPFGGDGVAQAKGRP